MCVCAFVCGVSPCMCVRTRVCQRCQSQLTRERTVTHSCASPLTHIHPPHTHTHTHTRTRTHACILHAGPYPFGGRSKVLFIRVPVFFSNVSEDDNWGMPWGPTDCPPGLCYNSTTRTKWCAGEACLTRGCKSAMPHTRRAVLFYAALCPYRGRRAVCVLHAQVRIRFHPRGLQRAHCKLYCAEGGGG